MNSPSDEVARRVAERLAPEVGPSLPSYVERAVALGDAAGEAAPQRSPDAALVVALAAFLVNLAKTTWDVYRELARSGSDALSPAEVALLRELIASRVREGAQPSEAIPNKMRIAVIEATVDETVAEAKRVEGKL